MVLRMACCNFSTNKKVKEATWRLVTILPPPGGQGKMTGYTTHTMSGSDKRTNEFHPQQGMLILCRAQEREMLSQS